MTPPNILLITKGHPFEKGPFFDLFDGLAINYTHVEQPLASEVLSPTLTADYDCLVFYDMPGIDFKPGGPLYREPPQALKTNFLNLLDAGKGMVFLHHAIAGWPLWPEYGEIIGGRFFYAPAKCRGKAVLDSGYRHDITLEVCGRCGGSVRIIACIEDQDVIDRILAHLERKEQNTPTLPHLAPPTRAPPGTLPLFAGSESTTTALNRQGSH